MIDSNSINCRTISIIEKNLCIFCYNYSKGGCRIVDYINELNECDYQDFNYLFIKYIKFLNNERVQAIVDNLTNSKKQILANKILLLK